MIEQRGLVVPVLTDNLLFASGSGTLSRRGYPLLTEIAQLIDLDRSHPVDVEGYTDDVPISTRAVPEQLGALDRRARRTSCVT